MKHFVEFDQEIKALFSFGSFVEAIDFVNQVADLAEQANHHPDIHLHDYNKVTITLSTHEPEKHLSDKDKEMAKQIEDIYKEQI